MKHVAQTCHPMPLSDLRQAATDCALPRRAIAITLDDGYRDALVASDILCEMQLPATFFVNSNQGRETFHDLLTRIFLESHPLPPELELSGNGVAGRISCRGVEARRLAYETVTKVSWPMSAPQRLELIDVLQRWSGIDLTPRRTHRVLTEAELGDLGDRPGHDIGVHTKNHLYLPAQPVDVRVDEIAGNRQHLERLLQREIESFSYPYGAVDLETVKICREMRFKTGVTVMRQAMHAGHDPLLVPRIEVKESAGADFELMLTSALSS